LKPYAHSLGWPVQTTTPTEEFTDGPFSETFGSGYGEPYNPRRQAFGMVGKRGVYCELSKEKP